MSDLKEYRNKRDFSRTAEPAGRRRKRHGMSFVVQKHDASHLHYDFRLELDGVLLSWAVPKGPSLDPGNKRLAMETEPHPLEYASFEGVIPQGEYGAGIVLVWDEGTWEPLADPRRGYREGRMRFRLHGQKLQGTWNLVRIVAGGRRSSQHNGRKWLLIKSRDEAARKVNGRSDIVSEQPQSVQSGRTLEQIAKASS